MPESGLRKIIKEMLEDAGQDVIEVRVINYVVRELHMGRRLSAILQDPYIKNRIEEERLAHILESTEVIQAVEEEINKAFKKRDFKFQD